MVKRARELISQNVSNSLPARDLDFDCLVESARKGERIPLIVFEEVVPFLAQGIGDVANMFNPELVIIGGQAVSAKEFILEPLRISVRTRAISEVSDSLTIKFSSLEQNVGALGASALISEEVAGY
jgi:predicted NBD/HSP70 family sugar kinase